uniref:Cytochrome c oxidase subunit 3 n=1 Tax=Geomydoecus aurei TaxID=161607 RepID=A0A8F4MBJ5_9NEOP|nr:cytochrome c oxidase subunit 3 [Geomydoecus aurei]
MRWVAHPFHIVTPSPWPVLVSFGCFFMVVMGLEYINGGSIFMFLVSFSLVCLLSFQWWRDVIREGTFQGAHTEEVQTGIRLGVVLFITSELMFFFSFFLSFFYLSLSPDIWLGMNWPPVGVLPVNWLGVPLLNTLILLSSGISVTWAHHGLMGKNLSAGVIGLTLTVILGMIFILFQAMEYYESSFSMPDSSFGSIFYLSTGFHGLHVLIGSVFLMVGLIRLGNKHMSNSHHLGFESAAWYWHFVDVVWLILFLCFYWWGS